MDLGGADTWSLVVEERFLLLPYRDDGRILVQLSLINEVLSDSLETADLAFEEISARQTLRVDAMMKLSALSESFPFATVLICLE